MEMFGWAQLGTVGTKLRIAPGSHLKEKENVTHPDSVHLVILTPRRFTFEPFPSPKHRGPGTAE